jgi:maltose/moltooligosaccharide transporter
MGFAMQSFSLVLTFKALDFTHLGVQNTTPLGVIPDSVKYSFYFGGIVFIITVLDRYYF